MKYDFGINVRISNPDCRIMLEFIYEYTEKESKSEHVYSFINHKAFNSFFAAINNNGCYSSVFKQISESHVSFRDHFG